MVIMQDYNSYVMGIVFVWCAICSNEIQNLFFFIHLFLLCLLYSSAYNFAMYSFYDFFFSIRW
jgi:hypothetical protein